MNKTYYIFIFENYTTINSMISRNIFYAEIYFKAFTIVIRFTLLYDKLLVSDEMFVNIYLPLL